MRIRMLQCMAGPALLLQVGRVYDVDDEDAQRLIDRGIAVDANTPPEEQPELEVPKVSLRNTVHPQAAPAPAPVPPPEGGEESGGESGGDDELPNIKRTKKDDLLALWDELVPDEEYPQNENGKTTVPVLRAELVERGLARVE